MLLSPRRLCAALAGCWMAALSVQAETLRLAADAWMPYNGEPGSALPGYAVEIAQAILAPHGITLDYRTMPWSDALKAAADGQIDAVVAANKDEAHGLITPTEHIGEPRIALIVLRGSAWDYKNITSLRTIKLGVMAGYKYWPVFDDYVAQHSGPEVVTIAGEHPLEDALQRLQKGEIDVLAETSSVVAWGIKRLGLPPAEFRVAYLHEGEPVYFAFTAGEKGQRYAKIFDDGLRELRRTKRLSAILAPYGLNDWRE